MSLDNVSDREMVRQFVELSKSPTRLVNAMFSELQQRLMSRLVELEATQPQLIGSDSGTHGKPDRWSVWETIDGRKFSTYTFARSSLPHPGEDRHRLVDEAVCETPGRIRFFNNAILAQARISIASIRSVLAV